jgi:AcrR family transcriptional regulator
MGEFGPAASPRPMRADARRNYEKLVEVGRAAFAARGAEASLDDIAKQAGVGPGTLYRHFPTRVALLEAVYRDDVTALCTHAEKLLADLPPAQALAAWMRTFVRYATTKRGLTEALRADIGEQKKTTPFFLDCSAAIRAAGGALLERAQQAGEVRTDASMADLLKLVHGIAVVTEHATDDDGQAERLLSVVLDGLRPHPA